jgi:hypothetical protein
MYSHLSRSRKNSKVGCFCFFENLRVLRVICALPAHPAGSDQRRGPILKVETSSSRLFLSLADCGEALEMHVGIKYFQNREGNS